MVFYTFNSHNIIYFCLLISNEDAYEVEYSYLFDPVASYLLFSLYYSFPYKSDWKSWGGY